MSASRDDRRAGVSEAVEDFLEGQEYDELIISCVGMPVCPFRGDMRTLNAEQGCPNCRRFIVARDGTTTEYRTWKH